MAVTTTILLSNNTISNPKVLAIGPITTPPFAVILKNRSTDRTMWYVVHNTTQNTLADAVAVSPLGTAYIRSENFGSPGDALSLRMYHGGAGRITVTTRIYYAPSQAQSGGGSMALPPSNITTAGLSSSFGPEWGGEILTITGSGFIANPVQSVRFGNTPAAFTVLNDSTIRVTTPAGTQNSTVSVEVIPSAGPTGVLPNAYTYSGWTVLTPKATSRLIYVSSSTGNNANSGFSPGVPKRTINGASGAFALLRANQPDWLMLRAGDIFRSPIGGFENIFGGPSPDAPMVITSYGVGARPILRPSPSSNALFLHNFNQQITRNVAVVDLDFDWTNTARAPGNAIQLTTPFSNILIEGCRISNFATGISISAPAASSAGLKIRRNVITECCGGPGIDGHGIYLRATYDDALIEENVLDHNGWSTLFTGSGYRQTNRRHNSYFQITQRVIARGNIVSRASNTGLGLRSGGIAADNFVTNNSAGILFGASDGTNYTAGGVTGSVYRNVIFDGKNVGGDNPNDQGWGIISQNVLSGEIRDNLIVHNRSGSFPIGMVLSSKVDGASIPSVGLRAISIYNNLMYNWGQDVDIEGPGGIRADITFRDNVISEPTANAGGTTRELINIDANGIFNPIDFKSANNRYNRGYGNSSWFVAGATSYTVTAWSSALSDTTSVGTVPTFSSPTVSPVAYLRTVGIAVPSPNEFINRAKQNTKASWNQNYTAWAINKFMRAGFDRI